MSTDTQAMPIFNQPRRKVSSSSTSPSLGRRRSSWEVLNDEPDEVPVDEDAMDTDDLPVPVLPDHPLREVAERVGKEVEIFAEELDKYLSKSKKTQKQWRKELVSLVKNFKACADDNVNRLRHKYREGLQEMFTATLNKKGRRTPDDYNMDADYQSGVDDLDRWQRESHTWALFQSMLESDHTDLKFTDTKSASRPNDKFTADGNSWRLFLEENETARERLKVIRWLESSAEITGNDVDLIEDSLASNSDRGTGFLYDGWMDTREKIKLEKRLRFWDNPVNSSLPNIQLSNGQGLLVTQLDPDSVSRQNRSLEPPDERFEHAFWELCWEMLRRGYSMDTIQNWCAERNELARAFSIGAHATSSTGVSSSTPNSRFLWRNACAIASKNSRIDYECAVYGLMAGHMDASTPPCYGWADHLFVLYNNILLRQYITFLHANNALDISKTGLAAYSESKYGTSTEDRIHSARSLVRSLASDPASQVDPDIPFQLIQSALIGHDLVNLIRLQGIALARDREDDIRDPIQGSPANLISAESHIDFIADDPDTLRFLAHTYLVFLELGVSFGADEDLVAAENVLCGYIRFLLHAGKMNLIPVYASRLSEKTRIDVLARVLPFISTQKDQQHFVALMVGSGIDVPEVLTRHVNLAMAYCSSILKPGDTRSVSVELTTPTSEPYWPGFQIKPRREEQIPGYEAIVYHALVWFLYIDGNWARTFESLTRAVIGFLKSGAIEVTLAIFSKLPFAEVSKAKTPDYMSPPFDITDEPEDDNYPSDSSDNEFRMLSNQLSPQKEDGASRSFGEPIRLETPEKTKVRRDLYKAHAMTYFQLGQLATALEALQNWANVEENMLKSNSRKDPEALSSAKKQCKKAVTSLVSAMEPLLYDFLTKPSPSATSEDLKQIRQMYLPQMILAYASALHSAGYLVSKDHLLQSLDLSTNIADNKLLVEDIKSQRLLGTLVDTFARASKSLLHLKEVGANKPRKRERPESAIWDI